ncbi:DUF6611 family protein [Rhodococcus sp. NPDC060176]|uniref:DUF6611 family protein n=1 Tax=Rhodococcus sp. NPDC060176 TaxID=3347062 RepID=UPI00366154B8
MTGSGGAGAPDRRERRKPIKLHLHAGLPLSARWGHLGIDLPPYLVTLSIFPPGASPRERALMRIRMRATTWTGSMFSLLILGFVAIAFGVDGAVITAAAGLGLWLGVRQRTARIHRETRHLQIVVRPDGVRGDVAAFESIAAQLDSLDAANLAPVNYEAEWGHIYRQLGPGRR